MITLIWALYLQFIFVLVLMALNFLIAIFSQSYESIMDRQIEAIIESNIALSQECLQELIHDDEEVQTEVDVIVMQTAVNLNANSEWDGIAQTIKKSLGKAQYLAEANQKELNSKIDGVKSEITVKFEESKKDLNSKIDGVKSEMVEMKAILKKIINKKWW